MEKLFLLIFTACTTTTQPTLPVAHRLPVLVMGSTPKVSDRFAYLTTLDCLALREDPYAGTWNPIQEIKLPNQIRIQNWTLGVQVGDSYFQGFGQDHAKKILKVEENWLTLDSIDGLVVNGDGKTDDSWRVTPHWGPNFDTLMDEYATKIKSQPIGERGIHMWHCEASQYVNPKDRLIRHLGDKCVDKSGKATTEDCPWADNGIKLTNEKVSEMMTALKKRGVELDYFHTSNEQAFCFWCMPASGITAMWNDPRFETSGLHKALDFVTLPGVTTDWWSHRDMVEKFGVELLRLTFKTFEAGLYKPVQDAFPKVKITDYAKWMVGEKYEGYDINGWPLNAYTGDGKTALPGQASDLNYLGCGQLCQNGMPGVGDYPATEWNRLILSLNQFRGMYYTRPEVPNHPVIAPHTFMGAGTGEAVYREHIYHLMLSGADALVFWNPSYGQDNDIADDALLESAVKEADKYVAYSDYKTLNTDMIPWRATEIRSCANANGKKICRVTAADMTGYWEVDGQKVITILGK